MSSGGTLLITRRNVSDLLNIDDCLAAVENAFRRYGEGKAQPPGVLGVHARDGGFHIKAGIMDLERSYFVSKTNANFPGNRKAGLPTIQGVIVVCDATKGTLLALMDSIQITVIRTGAATAVATKYLARANAKTALICGCGDQGSISLDAIMKVRDLERVFVYDIDADRARRFADIQSDGSGVEIIAVEDFAESAKASDIVVTCTTAKEPFLRREHLARGAFVAAVGADSEEKQELGPAVFSDSKIVADILEQCAAFGDLHHALKAGAVSRDDVHAELGEIVAGKKPGREDDDEIIVFDSTGMALQDVAAAAMVYENALKAKLGSRIHLND